MHDGNNDPSQRLRLQRVILVCAFGVAGVTDRSSPMYHYRPETLRIPHGLDTLHGLMHRTVLCAAVCMSATRSDVNASCNAHLLGEVLY